MNFVAHTQEELKNLNLLDREIYTIQYMNRSDISSDEIMQVSKAQVLTQNDQFVFKVSNEVGINQFIKEVKVIIENTSK